MDPVHLGTKDQIRIHIFILIRYLFVDISVHHLHLDKLDVKLVKKF